MTASAHGQAWKLKTIFLFTITKSFKQSITLGYQFSLGSGGDGPQVDAEGMFDISVPYNQK